MPVAEVYSKMKEMSDRSGEKSIAVSSLATELKTTVDLIKEYITALQILGFVQFDSHTNHAEIIPSLQPTKVNPFSSAPDEP
jgi:hypothetical protein